MPKLSFCIPTYNRAESVKKLVVEILSCDDPAIEVIVSDNCSTDNTLSSLSTIEDKRLSIYSNVKNQGSLLNAFNALSNATGEYIIFSTDKDFINSLNISEFITFLLENNTLSCGYCEYFPKPGAKNNFFVKGYEAVSKIGYLGNHPSGFFFNRKMLETTNYLTRFSNKNFIGEFAFDFISAELAVMSDVAVFNKQLNIPQTNSEAAKDKSLSISGTYLNAYYTPTSRLKMTINHTKHINQLALSVSERKKLILEKFIHGLFFATQGYKSILMNTEICEHYNLKPRKIELFENINTAWKFYKEYYNRAELVKEKNHLNKISFSFFVAKILSTRILKKIFIRILMNGK